MPKKKPQTGQPEVHQDLQGFEIKINEFGEIKTNLQVDKINEFLNKNVDDKKLRERDEKLAKANKPSVEEEWKEIMGEEE